MPHLAKDIDERRKTGRATRLKRAILYARAQKAARAAAAAAAAGKAVRDWWLSDIGDHHHEVQTGRFDRVFKGRHYALVDKLSDMIESGGRYETLVELGCGNGLGLDHLSERLPSLKRLIGLDINAEVIRKDAERHKDDPRLTFVEGEITRWLAAEKRDGTVVFANDGVLMYLSEDEVRGLFRRLAESKDVAVALIEPSYPG